MNYCTFALFNLEIRNQLVSFLLCLILPHYTVVALKLAQEGGKDLFFICIYQLQPLLHHLGIPQDIYRGCCN